jgi:hypothetical protein
MKNPCHSLPHAFPGALWRFSSLQSNASRFGLDLDIIIFHVLEKIVKLLRLAFSFILGYNESKFFW